ncbi:MAG: hemolysin family protein [Clostridia bacterium]|nr:hemolysin family protein [Clostridia bacterium]
MDEGSQLPWVFAAILLGLAAFFAVAETAFASCSKAKIRAADDRGDLRAKEALSILDRFDKAVTTLLICTNIAHIAVASIVTVTVTRLWGLSAVTLATAVTTIVVFFLGETLPKNIAKMYPERCALACARPLTLLMKVLSPFANILTAIGDGVAKHTSSEPELTVTENEIYDIIEDMTEEGTLDEAQGDLISSALQFGDVMVESILTPRVDVAAVNADAEPEEILAFVREQNHSRLPVYEGSIDHVIGVLQIRTFIKAWMKEGAHLDVRKLLDEPLFVHQSTEIDELLPLMSRKKHNLAVVTDNYGGTLGIVTIEDILEELVGEIWDEDDVVEEAVVQLNENEYAVDAEESVSDAFERIGFEDPEEDEELVNTLMGEWAYEQFAAIPKPGDSFTYHGLNVTVDEMEHNRIIRLKVRIPVQTEGGADA